MGSLEHSPELEAVEADRGALPPTGLSSMSLVLRAAGIMLMGTPLVMYARRLEA